MVAFAMAGFIEKQNCQIILASTSEIRRRLLSEFGLAFQALKPEFDEESAKSLISHLPVKEQALFLASNKARQVSVNHPDALVIASDQICQLGKAIISKSRNRQQAIEQLTLLSGRTHYQNNAVCLYQGGREIFSHFDRAKLKMRPLSQDEIEDYVDVDVSWGTPGSYKFESKGRDLFSEVRGNYETILGMTLQPLINFLHCKKLILLSKDAN